jgi:YjbE family integral membrane protein
MGVNLIMEFLSPEFFSALLAIIVIDLVLAGDNAIVIGLAARTLPKEQQRKVIFWGTFGAVAIRSVLTLFAVYLLMIPGLMGIGGALLLWIAYKLLAEDKGHEVKEAATFGEAVRTVLIADTVMGLDNVLAVAGAAHGDFLLVVLGLLISVPIVVWGSTLILRLVERFPSIIYIGSGVLALTAAKMITAEKFLTFFAGNPGLKWTFTVVAVAAVLFAGWMKKRKTALASS